MDMSTKNFSARSSVLEKTISSQFLFSKLQETFLTWGAKMICSVSLLL